MQVTQARANELLNYCPISGQLHWKVYRNSQALAGQLAGHLNKQEGYLTIGIDGKVYNAHRVIWLMQTGTWPDQIDHKDHVRSSNRWTNLREVSQAANLKNKSKSKANTSGYTGVYPTPRGKWIARISSNGRQINLGTFEHRKDAHIARQQANQTHNFHQNHGL